MRRFVTVLLLAPSTAFACVLEYDIARHDLKEAMAAIDEAEKPAVEAEKPAVEVPVQALVPVQAVTNTDVVIPVGVPANGAPNAPQRVIPEVQAPPRAQRPVPAS